MTQVIYRLADALVPSFVQSLVPPKLEALDREEELQVDYEAEDSPWKMGRASRNPIVAKVQPGEPKHGSPASTNCSGTPARHRKSSKASSHTSLPGLDWDDQVKLFVHSFIRKQHMRWAIPLGVELNHTPTISNGSPASPHRQWSICYYIYYNNKH